MTEAEARARIETLRRDITKHNRRYYEEAAPTITDREYDQLYRELAELEKNIRNSLARIRQPGVSAGNRSSNSRRLRIACRCLASTIPTQSKS